MSKISYVSGTLHRISDQLSEATAKKNPSPGEEAPETPSDHSGKTLQPPHREEVRKDYAELHKHLKPRFEELLRLKRDVNARIEEHKALYSAQSETLRHRKEELDAAVAVLDALRNSLNACDVPNFADPDFKPRLADALRLVENARLEDIKTAARMEGSLTDRRKQGTPTTSATSSFAMMSGGELFKKGFAFFLPLILTLLFSTLLLAAAFFAAWKIAF